MTSGDETTREPLPDRAQRTRRGRERENPVHAVLLQCLDKEKVEKEREFQRGKTLTWKDVNYVVPVPGGTRRLLHDVTGYVKSGQLVALMGASGAGKTTALDVLAQRKNIGVVSGDILVGTYSKSQQG